MDKTKKQLEEELDLIKRFAVERILSNEMYAIKLVEKIVFGLVTLILLGFFGAVVAFFINPR